MFLARPADSSKPGAPAVKVAEYFDTERQAQGFADRARAEIQAQAQTIDEARERYEKHLVAQGNKPNSIYRTMWSIKRFFGSDLTAPLNLLSPRRCQGLYDALAAGVAVDSHRNALAEVKTFARWMVAQALIAKSPVEQIQGTGRRTTRKPQLRFEAARKWYDTAMELAETGDDGAIAALLALIMAMRASEIVTRKVCDVDTLEERADVLWIPDSKTEAGQRILEVPPELRPLLIGLVEARPANGWLFPTTKGESGRHDRDWPRHQVKRICDLAGVASVTAHGMRGLHATIAKDRGATGAMVAGTLGHAHERITAKSYTDPHQVAAGVRRRTVRILSGGRGSGE